MDGFPGHVRRNTEDVQSQPGLSSHGVDIREGIGSGDLAKKVGIVGNGREEVHRLHQCQVIGYLVDGGVITFVKAHQKVGVIVDFDAVQQLRQHAGTHLGTAAGTFGQFCQLYFARRCGTSTTCWPNGISTVQTMCAPG